MNAHQRRMLLFEVEATLRTIVTLTRNRPETSGTHAIADEAHKKIVRVLAAEGESD